MRNKKLFTWIAALAFGLLASSMLVFGPAFGSRALAEQAAQLSLPLNPGRADAMARLDSAKSARRLALRARSADALSVSLEWTSGEYLTEETTWTAMASGGDGSYQYAFQLINGKYDSDYDRWDLNADRGSALSNVFSYQLMVPGSYELAVWVTDGSGATAYTSISFTVENSAYRTLEQRVAQIVGLCNAAGCRSDYEKALWLHDWLINNAGYDHTLTYYSADGVLLRGTGVCDSYSKAYLKLLRAAGLECLYVSGEATSNGVSDSHSWNVVKMDGKWYNIDPTWDDSNLTVNDPTPVSGWENHLYFALPDDIFLVDHAGSSGVSCNSLEDNYFIRSGKVSMWTDELEGELLDALEADGYAFGVALENRWYRLERGENYYGQGSEHIVYSLAAYAMNRRAGWQVGSQTLGLTIQYSAAKNAMSGSVVFEDVLKLPPALSDIGQEAFMGSADIMYVVLPENVSVGARAFANCAGLWRVDIPDSVKSIDSTAFAGSGHVTIVCGAGSAAETYAKRNGVKWKNR